jgi:hypothetical protein
MAAAFRSSAEWKAQYRLSWGSPDVNASVRNQDRYLIWGTVLRYLACSMNHWLLLFLLAAMLMVNVAPLPPPVFARVTASAACGR